MELSDLSIWYWIALLLVAGLGAIVGYLIGRGPRPGPPADTAVPAADYEKLRADLVACREELAATADRAIPKDIPFDFKAAKAVFGTTVKQDDLKVIEGIGPKIESLFHNYDIKTWRALATSSVAKCQEVLDSGGDRYKIHDPSSWPMQAHMAYENKWKELKRWQDEHLHGKL